MLSMGNQRMETMRRLGVEMVRCSECKKSMRKPPDPFTGPHVMWGSDPETYAVTSFYVCSSGCSASLRKRLHEQGHYTKGGA